MSNTTMDVSFDLCRRNDMLAKKGLKPPGYLKTGTTIVGLIFENGVILGADTRATEGPIHYMAPNIYCCGAGTAADTEAVTDNIISQLKLHRYHTGRESRVVTALTLFKSHLFRYQGHVSGISMIQMDPYHVSTFPVNKKSKKVTFSDIRLKYKKPSQTYNKAKHQRKATRK